MIDEHTFLNALRICSFKAIFNFINTCRNKGKTWIFCRIAFTRFKKHGKTTLWIRRYKDELKKTKGKLFKPKLLKQLGLNESNFKWVGFTAYYKRKDTFEPFLYLLSLSQAKAARSSDDGRTRLIVFDEYTTTPAKYALYRGNEVEDFLDIVDSMRREHEIQVFLLGNKESAINPYFRYFGIKPMPENFEGIRTYNDGTILCYYSNTVPDEIAKTDFSSRYNKALKNTPHLRYLNNGETKGKSNRVEKCPKKNKLVCQFDFIGGFSIYACNNKLYVCCGLDKSKLVYVNTPKSYAKQISLASSDKVMFSDIVTAYKYGLMFFDTQAAEELFLPVKALFQLK